MDTIVIADNNPNILPGIVLILVVAYIISNLIEIRIKRKRIRRLEEVKRKIVKRHDIIELERTRREQINNAKDVYNNTPF